MVTNRETGKGQETKARDLATSTQEHLVKILAHQSELFKEQYGILIYLQGTVTAIGQGLIVGLRSSIDHASFLNSLATEIVQKSAPELDTVLDAIKRSGILRDIWVREKAQQAEEQHKARPMPRKGDA